MIGPKALMRSLQQLRCYMCLRTDAEDSMDGMNLKKTSDLVDMKLRQFFAFNFQKAGKKLLEFICNLIGGVKSLLSLLSRL